MGGYADRLLGSGPVQTQAPMRSGYADRLLGAPEQIVSDQQPSQPKQEGWGEWIVNSVRGRQDPREAETGTVFEQFRGELGNPTANAAIGGASDEAMADVIQKNLGDRFIRQEKDANNYPVIVTRGADGREQRGYVNKPGLDTQDVSRAVYGSLPYLVTGGAAGALTRGAGVGLQALAQGVASGATSLGGDAATMAQGSEQGLDVGKAGLMAGFGAAGPVASKVTGALWRKFVTIPGYFDKSTGQLTAKGIEAARKAGVDPSDITPDFAQGFAKTLAETGDEAASAIKAGADRYGIPATRGQVTKDPYLLTQEEGMRRRLYGEAAQDTMRGFDERQSAAVSDAALGRMGGTGGKSVAETINPANAGLRPGPAMLGENVQAGLQSAREAARQAEKEAWKGATALEATPEALKTLPDFLNAKLGGMMPDETVTPSASAMARSIERFMKGEAPEKAAEWLKASPNKNIDQMRRSLGSLMDGAQGSDKAMSGAMYDGFNDWITDAAEKSLLAGDPVAAMNLVKARGFTRDVRALFEPKTAQGTLSPAGQRLSRILDGEKADSGEEVIKALFGSQGSKNAAAGMVSALNSIKGALRKFAPDVAEQTWADLKLAYWTRLVTAKTGEMAGPQQVVSNIKTAFNNQRSVVQTLYSPQEMLEIRSFLRAMEAIAYKPPNASGSGYTAASFMKDGLLKVLDAFGLGKPATAALNYTGVGNAWNAATARQAVSGAVRPRVPNLTPAVTAAGQAGLPLRGSITRSDIERQSR